MADTDRPYHTCPGTRNGVHGTWRFYHDCLVFVPDDGRSADVTTDPRIIAFVRDALDAPPKPGAV
jgi:hypothetical protein